MGKRLLNIKVIHSRWFVAAVISIVAMLLASIALFFPNTRLWTILIVGALVFIIVIYILSYSRYLRLAKFILGGIVASSWIAKGIFAFIEIEPVVFLGVSIEEITWQDSFNLTICFVVLVLSDIFVNHFIPYLEKLSEKKGPPENDGKFQNIRNINAEVVNLTQNYTAGSASSSQVSMPANLLEELMNDQYSKGFALGEKQKECDLLLQKQDAESDTGQSATDKDVKYINVLQSKIEILKSQAQQAIDELEYEDYFEKTQGLGKIVEAEENILPAMLLREIYIFLANMEITKANWLKNTKGKERDLTQVKYYFEKAKNVRSE